MRLACSFCIPCDTRMAALQKESILGLVKVESYKATLRYGQIAVSPLPRDCKKKKREMKLYCPGSLPAFIRPLILSPVSRVSLCSNHGNVFITSNEMVPPDQPL